MHDRSDLQDSPSYYTPHYRKRGIIISTQRVAYIHILSLQPNQDYTARTLVAAAEAFRKANTKSYTLASSLFFFLSYLYIYTADRR